MTLLSKILNAGYVVEIHKDAEGPAKERFSVSLYCRNEDSEVVGLGKTLRKALERAWDETTVDIRDSDWYKGVKEDV